MNHGGCENNLSWRETGFSNIYISSQTTTKRIEEISEDIKSSKQNPLKNLEYLSIAIDKSAVK